MGLGGRGKSRKGDDDQDESITLPTEVVHLASGAGFHDDLAGLAVLSEAILVHELRARFTRDCICECATPCMRACFCFTRLDHLAVPHQMSTVDDQKVYSQ